MDFWERGHLLTDLNSVALWIPGGRLFQTEQQVQRPGVVLCLVVDLTQKLKSMDLDSSGSWERRIRASPKSNSCAFLSHRVLWEGHHQGSGDLGQVTGPLRALVSSPVK